MRTVIATLMPTALVLLGISSAASAADLAAGVAVTDITPLLGYRMCGYFHERQNTGTHDPLHAKALVLQQGRESAALVFCDIIGLSPDVARQAREVAAEKTGIPFSHILIAATHSHTGPLYFGAIRKLLHDQAVAKNGHDPCEKVDYPAILARRIADAVVKAKANLRPIGLNVGVASETRLAFNRRWHMKDGTVRFNPGSLNPNMVRPAGPIDPDIGVLLIRDTAKDRPFAALTVFALHLDTVGGTEYSGDFPHYLEESLRKDLGADFVSFFGNGTCGDINHVDFTKKRRPGGQVEAKRIGTALAETVKAELPKLKPLKTPSLAVRSTTLQVPMQRYSPDRVAKAKADMPKTVTTELPFLQRVEIYKIVAVDMRGGSTLPMEVQVFRIANDLAIVGLPGEFFVDLGLAIKKASPFKTTMVVELCNDTPGYVPTEKAFKEGSYETVNSRIAPGGGETLVAAATRLLKELHAP